MKKSERFEKFVEYNVEDNVHFWISMILGLFLSIFPMTMILTTPRISFFVIGMISGAIITNYARLRLNRLVRYRKVSK